MHSNYGWNWRKKELPCIRLALICPNFDKSSENLNQNNQQNITELFQKIQFEPEMYVGTYLNESPCSIKFKHFNKYAIYHLRYLPSSLGSLCCTA